MSKSLKTTDNRTEMEKVKKKDEIFQKKKKIKSMKFCFLKFC